MLARNIFLIKNAYRTLCVLVLTQSRKRVTAAERRRNRVRILNSRFKPPSILASWLVNTSGFNAFIIVVLVVNALIVGVDVECTMHWPDSMEWLHLTVDVVSVVGQ